MSINSRNFCFRRATHLEFVYERSVKAQKIHVWQALTDPVVMNTHLPGGVKISFGNPDEYLVTMKVSVGFMRPTVKASVRLSDIREPNGFELSISGKAMGAGVTGTGSAQLDVASEGRDATMFTLSGAIETTGLLKKISDDKIRSSANDFLDDYFSNLEETVDL